MEHIKGFKVRFEVHMHHLNVNPAIMLKRK